MALFLIQMYPFLISFLKSTNPASTTLPSPICIGDQDTPHRCDRVTNRQHNGYSPSTPQPRRPPSPFPLPLPRVQRRRTRPLTRDPRRPWILRTTRDAHNNRPRLERTRLHSGNRWVSSSRSPKPQHSPHQSTRLTHRITNPPPPPPDPSAPAKPPSCSPSASPSAPPTASPP